MARSVRRDHWSSVDQPRIVEVWWIDAYTQQSWHNRKDTERRKAVCVSVGYLVGEDSDFVTLALTLGSINDDGERWDADTLHIPRGCVRLMRTVARRGRPPA